MNFGSSILARLGPTLPRRAEKIFVDDGAVKRSRGFLRQGLVLAMGLILSGCGNNDSSSEPIPKDPTFAEHVAPIVFQNCSSCHRPGQSAPFDLLTYDDVKKRGRQIVEVIEDRYMPPWLPDPAYARFRGERRLTDAQIATVRQWVENGAPEGDLSRLPESPTWPDGWKLGEPDLVISMPEPYALRAGGEDVYRNFVIPVPIEEDRYVRAVEFDPGNRRIVHHAFFMLDTEGGARAEDVRDAEPGFSGIHAPPGVASPSSHFLSWQPGKQPSPNPDEMAWVLKQGTDFVLQLHLQPTGKPETIQSSIALYFTSQPPARHPLKLWLSSYDIDIPAGESAYVLEDTYQLPADVEVLAILPHAHYLAREMQAFATLPGGQQKWLLWIKDWDFNWQGDYQYEKPVFLPQGSRLTMRYRYDNSTNNPVNPHHPPQRVQYGLQSTDEMGELWLQVLPRSEAGRRAIEADYQQRVLQDSVAYNKFLLRSDPEDARAWVGLGKALLYQGKFDEARAALERAASGDQTFDEPHYFLGLLHRMNANIPQAREHFQTTVRLNPRHAKAEGNLGIIAFEQRDWDSAEKHLRRALELNPGDELARKVLEDVRRLRR